MPEKSGLAFIVIQHLSPDYKSLMVERLSKKTKIPVHRCNDGMVMVQGDATAKFDGMLRAAISTGVADFILPPEKMAAQPFSFPYRERRRQHPADAGNLLSRFISVLENQYLPFSAIVNQQMEVLTLDQVTGKVPMKPDDIKPHADF